MSDNKQNTVGDVSNGPVLTDQSWLPINPDSRPSDVTVTRLSTAGLWWRTVLTLGIAYLVWFARVNRELAAVRGAEVPTNGKWWGQLIPVYNIVGLAATARRVNEAHAAYGSPERVSPTVTWLWRPIWFWTPHTYLQKRVNILHDVQVGKVAAMASMPASEATPTTHRSPDPSVKMVEWETKMHNLNVKTARANGHVRNVRNTLARLQSLTDAINA